MSTTIDQKVVEMRFDNKHFENNVQTTMSTLDKLKQRLNLTGATKGLENIDSASKKVNMSTLGSAVETVQAKFSALQVMGTTALANITNSAVNAGKRIVSALTIDPIKTGFSEYETQIGAVQTILANTSSKGTTLQDVNSALDTLNTYADKTIYNFTEMTRNIGTFTAAGVDLDTSVKSIQGIANLAAVSGSTSQQASTAMYQLSQALAAGKVSLMDWNSVVNAGMGGQVFQDALKRTAKNMGKDVDGMIKKYGSFRESLTEGEWLTTDVLTKTLEQFTMAAEEGTEQWDAYKKSLMDSGYTASQAEEILKMANTATDAATKVKTFTQLWDTLKESAQSGWTQTWEIIMGDFEEAKGFLTDVSNTIGGMIGASADARNSVLSEGLSTGWKQLLGAGIADEEGYKETLQSVAKDHGVALDKMIKKEKELDSSLSDGEAFQKALKKGIAEGSLTADMFSDSVHKMADKMSKMSAKELEAAGYTQEHVDQIKKLSAGLKDGSISMDDFVKKISRNSGRENIIQALWNSFNALMSIVNPIKEAFSEIFKPLTGDQLYSFTEALVKFTEKLTLSETASDNLKRTFKGLFAGLDIVKQAFMAVVKAIFPLFGSVDNLGGGILGITAKWGDWIVALNESIKKAGIFETAVEWVHKAFENIKNALKPIIDGIKSFGESISNTFTDISDKATERLGPLTILGNFIKAIFVAIGKLIAKIAPYVAAAASGIGSVISSLMETITSSVQNADYNGLFDVLNGGIISAIGIFIAKFIKSGGDILDNASGFIENLKGILDGVGDALGAFTQSLKANTLKKIAISIGILAASLLVLSLIDSNKLTASLTAISILFAELMGSMSIFGKIADDEKINSLGKISRAMIGLSVALLVLSVALKIMSTMSLEEMGVGLVTMTVGLGALVGAVNLLPEKDITKAAKAIRKLSTSLLVLSIAIKIMSTMSWQEMGVALISMTAGLGALIGAIWLMPKDSETKISGMISLATAMVILGVALRIMSTMSWEEMGVALVSLAGSLGILAGAMHLMNKAVAGAAAIKLIAPALIMLSIALKVMGSMSWDDVARGLASLAGSMLILAVAMRAMEKTIVGAYAIKIVVPSLIALAVAMKIMGSMSWIEIARGLALLAGSFIILGVAGAVLGPLAPVIMALAKSVALLGLACLAMGAGVVMLGVGLTTLAAALAASGGAIVVFVTSLIGLIPYLIEQIGVGIIKLCEVISGSAAAICEAATVIIVALVDALVASVPAIVDGALVLITALLESLVKYTPIIVTALFDFLIGVIDACAEKLPDLIQAGVNLLMALFQGVVDALKGVDSGLLVEGIMAVGMLSALVIVLAAVAALTPLAMVGVLGLGAVVTELSIVLAAIGALAQIPGLEWLINEGASLMQTIGNAIGQFLGGIVGGFAQGMSSALPQIGSDLSAFMQNAKPFIEGAKMIDETTLNGVHSLVGVILALTAANVLEGLTSWLTGGSSLSKFGDEIAAFAPKIKQYADTVSGIDASAVEASANAAKTLSELATNLPNSGGLAGWFAGENDIGSFGEQLVPFGKGMKAYSDAISGFNPEAVIASAHAAQALVDMTSNIPNEGGMVAWFTGDNSVSKFADDLVTLGSGLKAYSDSIAGFNAEAVIASANAAQALADMTSHIPNEGGMAAWFTGENSVAAFSDDLILLANGLKAYSDIIVGFNAEAVIASANAAQALADMTSHIPNEGGMAAWFTGENSVAKFAEDLVSLGRGLLSFSNSVTGINIESVNAAVTAAENIAQLANTIPNEGGMVAWFTGENSISKFAGDLPKLGAGLKSFSDSVSGINAENMLAASNAAKNLATMVETIPKEGGIKAWFTGETSVAKFADKLPDLGDGLKDFSDAIAGMNAENVSAAAKAAKNLAQMTSYIPKEGGIKAWFTGDTSVANFADKLPDLGEGLKDFSDSIAGINPENVVAASKAAKNLAEMTKTTPKNTDKLESFGKNLNTFGSKLKSYFDKVSGVSGETITKSSDAISAINKHTANMNTDKVSQAANAISDLIKAMKKMSGISGETTAGFNKALTNLGKTNISTVLKAFKGAEPKMFNAGQSIFNKFITGAHSQTPKISKAAQTIMSKFISVITKQSSKAKSAGVSMVDKCASAIKGQVGKFSSAGTNLVKGFAAGISSSTYLATAKARAMAKAAAQAARDELDINSPSKVFRRIGMSIPEGFALGIDKLSNVVSDSSIAMARTAINSARGSLARIADVINSDVDAQPTIRPVLDLSDVKAGANAIGGMLTGRTLSVNTEMAGAVSASMLDLQNGSDSSDIVSAIKGLRKDIADMPRNSYNINGITYDDGSNITDAVKSIVRAARVERRI